MEMANRSKMQTKTGLMEKAGFNWKVWRTSFLYSLSFNKIENRFVTYQTGQMLYMEEWKMIVFLGTPQMKDLDAMIKLGLFINDLSMHDFSR